MSATVRFGVLGCSSIAWRRCLPAMLTSPAATLVAVASRDPEKAKRFAGEFDCLPTTYDELLRREDIDAVYVPLPTSLHLPWGLEVLRAGKHLLLEKPIGTTAAEAAELIREAHDRDLVLRENFTFVHHSQHRAVRDLLAAGEIGEVRSFSAAFCFPPLPDDDIRYAPELGGGALLDAGVYPIRAAQFLLGDDLRVAGSALRMHPDRGVDIAGQALLVSGGGVTISVRFGFEHDYGSRYSVWGSTGQLLVDRAFTPPQTWSPVLRVVRNGRTEELTLPPDHQFENAVSSFASAVLARRVAGDDNGATIIRTMELVDEIRRQAVLIQA
jgi:predicted dehydrogenase